MQKDTRLKKIAVLFSKFEDFHWQKDPGYISCKLNEMGYNISVFSTLEFSTPENKNIDIYTLAQEEYFTGLFLEKYHFDQLFIYHFDFRYIPLLRVAKSLGIKVIIKADHNGYLPIFESDIIRQTLYYKTKKIVKSLLNLDYKKKFSRYLDLVDFVIIESFTGYRRFVSMFPEFASKFIVIPNGYDFPGFAEYKKEKKIVAIGRWDDIKQKRVHRLLGAFILSSEKSRHNYKLYLIGDCPDKIKNRYESKNIIFKGKQTRHEIEKELKTSKILMMSSEWESFGNVLVEALSFNNTIVSTPHVGALDVSLDGHCGLVSEDYTVKDLANALVAEIELWENGYRNQKEIHDISSKYFDWSKVITKIEEILS